MPIANERRSTVRREREQLSECDSHIKGQSLLLMWRLFELSQPHFEILFYIWIQSDTSEISYFYGYWYMNIFQSQLQLQGS